MKRKSKKGERTEVFSVFGQIESVACEIMLKEGKGVRIDVTEIPASVLFNDIGQKARFAFLLQKKHLPEFNRLVADLRA